MNMQYLREVLLCVITRKGSDVITVNVKVVVLHCLAILMDPGYTSNGTSRTAASSALAVAHKRTIEFRVASCFQFIFLHYGC